ncbi:MAG: Na/Pi cotransporter family protein [Eubacterium sp.]|nr:Na/Pi cotransporter family protein [Eubacterium sp.]
MDIFKVLQLFGGIGLFLFGMSNMSSSIEKLAGSGLERLLEKITTSKKRGVGSIKGWTFGTLVTAIIQSSAATTLMLVGFVNAGIMKATQALPVVFGANLGSTATAQIIRLGDVSGDSLALNLLKTDSLAPMLVGLGAFIIVFSKNKKAKSVAGILVGLGVLFYGMNLMEGVFAPLKNNPKFQSFFTSFENPLVGILIGLVITAILQSSSASVGILQALSASGMISYAVAIPIIIGQNIGKCSTTIIGGIGANKNAKRIVAGYVLFNIFGAVFFTAVIYGIHYTIGLSFMSNLANRGSIANIHLLFNMITGIILLPFTGTVSNITEKIVGKEEEKLEDVELTKLDDMLLNTPTIALQQCKAVITKMSEAILENYKLATSMIYEYNESKLPQMEDNEAFIDKCETALSSYIVRIDRKRLTRDDKLTVSEILNSIGDFERMGDYCMNIAYVARDKNEQDIHFSPSGHKEVETIIAAVEYTIETAVKAFNTEDSNLAVRVEPLSEAIDELKEVIKSHHVERLQEGVCSIEGGVSLFDLINSFERIASHAANVSLHVIKKIRRDSDFDEMHGHATDVQTEEYKALYHYYESQYIEPILMHHSNMMGNALDKDSEEKNLPDKKSGKKGSDKKTSDKKSSDKKASDKKGAPKKSSDKNASDKKDSDNKDDVETEVLKNSEEGKKTDTKETEKSEEKKENDKNAVKKDSDKKRTYRKNSKKKK